MTDWNNKKEVMKKLEYEGYYLEYASEELRADKEVVMTAVKQNGYYALEHASEELKNTLSSWKKWSNTCDQLEQLFNQTVIYLLLDVLPIFPLRDSRKGKKLPDFFSNTG